MVKKVEDFVFELFKSSDNSNLLFHDYKHTYDVVSAAIEIGKGSDLSEDDLELLQIAAWFHDTGYFQSPKGHEKISAEIAVKFLKSENFDPKKIEKIKALIEVTEIGKKPQNHLEEVMCDADLQNLGTSDYKNRANLLRDEALTIHGKQLDELAWLEWELKFLNEHKYYTRYMKLNYNPIKNNNIVQLKQEIKKLKDKNEESLSKSNIESEKVNAYESFLPGMEYMFREVLRDHISLSVIADNKANLILSVNAIIISITISVLIQNYDVNPTLNIPTVFLLLVSVLTMVFAALSTKPSKNNGKFTKEDVLNKKANLLFFGNYHNTSFELFEWGIKEMMNDKDYLYHTMIKDLHSIGKVLNKKYHFLRIAYLLFLYGITISVVLFMIFMAYASRA